MTCLTIPGYYKFHLYSWIYSIADPVCFGIFLLFISWFGTFQLRFIRHYEQDSVEPKDFTIKISNLPTKEFVDGYLAFNKNLI